MLEAYNSLVNSVKKSVSEVSSLSLLGTRPLFVTNLFGSGSPSINWRGLSLKPFCALLNSACSLAVNDERKLSNPVS